MLGKYIIEPAYPQLRGMGQAGDEVDMEKHKKIAVFLGIIGLIGWLIYTKKKG